MSHVHSALPVFVHTRTEAQPGAGAEAASMVGLLVI